MKLFIYILLFGSAFYSCKKAKLIDETELLNNQTFERNIKVDGHQFDGLIIDNCVFDGGNLSLGNADSVVIRNCEFKNIKDNALKIGFIGPSNYITIENCNFENIGFNGIDSHEDAANCRILNCSFKNIALSETGAAMAQAHHGIYWKGKNVYIANNYFVGGAQAFGNAISVRSSGIIRNNIIQGAPKNGIMYYADHPGEDSLYIENNFLINNAYGIAAASAGNEEFHNKHVIIRFNSLIQNSNYSIYISEKFENTTNFGVYGNILVNSSETYLKTFYEVAGISNNLMRNTDIGFVDPANNDLHLKPDSEAINYCNGLTEFPLKDIDDENRISTELNAGADG